MTVKLLTAHHSEFQSLKGGCTGLSESTLVKFHIVGNHMSWFIWCGSCLCFTVVVLCLCSVSLPHGAVGWSAVNERMNGWK